MKGANGKAGFTPRKSPGSLPGVYETAVERPSAARSASVPAAISAPIASPRSLAAPAGSESTYDWQVGSYWGPRLGKRPRNTPQAAAAAAALTDAPAVPALGVVAKGSNPPLIETTASYIAT